MKEFLYASMRVVAAIHEKIMMLNDAYETNFSDKDLHFLVIGLLGLAMVFVVYPLFCHLAKKNRIMTITWIYVFTVIIVITFAIEIGQKISKTGNMDFGDIMYGVVGFLAMFVGFCLVRAVYHGIRKLIRHLQEKDLPQGNS